MSKYNLTTEEKRQLVKGLEARETKVKYNQLDKYFPTEGPLRRELYPRHLAFFRAGQIHNERAFIASNRCGKTIAGAFEMTLHLTGLYPDWWDGRRFNRPVDCWVSGVTNEQTRDVLQKELLGRKQDMGTGMIPKDLIIRTTHRSLPPDSVADAYIKHVSGGTSVVSFKSAIQGRETYQGTAKDVIWCDEEMPDDVYLECLLRTMTNNGMTMITFTPLQDLTPLVLSFMPGGEIPANGIVPDNNE